MREKERKKSKRKPKIKKEDRRVPVGTTKAQRKKPLRRKGRDPTSTDLPAVISVEIVRRSFNFNSFPEFTMMELSNLGNNLGLLNTNLMLGLLYMLC